MSAAGDGLASARRFVARLPALDIAGKAVLDLRCGGGETCLLLAEGGAREILGVDARDVSAAHATLERAEPHVRRRVRFEQVEPGAWMPPAGRYELIVLRGGFGRPWAADCLLAQARTALAPTGSALIEFFPRRRFRHAGGEDVLTREQFAAAMARSRLHCTWYRAGFSSASVLSLWRQPVYD